MFSMVQFSLVRHTVQVFSRYEKHRDLILEDIFASLARLPTTKRNLRSFKLVRPHPQGPHPLTTPPQIVQWDECPDGNGPHLTTGSVYCQSS